MNTDYLREFTLLAQYGSFSKTAQALHISQPALSSHIAALEKEAGATLVDRSRQEIALTPIGRAWLPDVNVALAQLDGLAPKLKRLKRHPAMKVVAEGYLGHTLASDALRSAAQTVRRENPLFEIELRDIDLFTVTENVLTGATDLCLILDNRPIPAGLDIEPVRAEPLRAIVPADSPLGAGGPLDPADLAEQTLVVPASVGDHAYLDSIQELLDDRGIRADIESVYFTTISDLYDFDFQDKVYLDIASATAALSESLRKRYRIVPFSDPAFRFNIALVTREDNQNPGLPLFVEALRTILTDDGAAE